MEKDKHEQIARYLRGMKHHKTRDEERQIRQRSRARKAAQKGRRPRPQRDWLDAGDDEIESFEKIRSPQGRGVPASPSPDPVAAEHDEPAGELREAIVASAARTRFTLLVDRTPLSAELAPALQGDGATRPVVGDRVTISARGAQQARIESVLPRATSLARPDPQARGRTLTLAANVDRAVILLAARRPAFRPRLVDRLLVAVEFGGVEPVICINKGDLLSESERAELDAGLTPYRDLGHPCRIVSSLERDGRRWLLEQIAGRHAVLVGPSGAGKSSWLNALAPDVAAPVGRVRAGDGKGRHTTTASALHDLGGGTWLIDTPGVRSFGLDLRRDELRLCFPELVERAPGCRYNDCAHVTEPGCAVREAVLRGEIARARYDAYRLIHDSLE